MFPLILKKLSLHVALFYLLVHLAHNHDNFVKSQTLLRKPMVNYGKNTEHTN